MDRREYVDGREDSEKQRGAHMDDARAMTRRLDRSDNRRFNVAVLRKEKQNKKS